MLRTNSFLRAWPLRLLGLAAVWILTAGANSCSVNDSAGGPTFVTELEIRNSTGAADRLFSPGESITFELRVRNRTRSRAVVQFGTTQQSDFVVFNDGASQPRWRWSTGRAFPAITTEMEFAPGETKVLSSTWDQVADDGLPVGVGDYEARGALMFSQFAVDPHFPSQLASSLKEFSIQ